MAPNPPHLAQTLLLIWSLRPVLLIKNPFPLQRGQIAIPYFSGTKSLCISTLLDTQCLLSPQRERIEVRGTSSGRIHPHPRPPPSKGEGIIRRFVLSGFSSIPSHSCASHSRSTLLSVVDGPLGSGRQSLYKKGIPTPKNAHHNQRIS